ncbi:NTE family protein [Neisseria perflava]|uniref:patatin-like phospholipase family protein n=1 Tax=Neisseria perflava TaxID=33053 RepID=UPI0020A1733A|nr:patatin-like phospholipase family protein [Neisseria perflava]MCP1771331.1 NTE family protein [Neisseria perflava]
MPLKTYAKHALTALTTLALSACSLVKYQPLETIDKVDLTKGYRLERQQADWSKDDTLVVLMFSGGGTRAAALGYGVLEELNRSQVTIGGQNKSLLEHVDVVIGVSGGSVLAAYYALNGKDTIPAFYKRFLRQNFQRTIIKQAFSAANLPRLASPEFGRGDLLQEQFETYLFGDKTFDDLDKHRKGPFAIVTASDMGTSSQLKFIQESFDPMCLNLGDLHITRAVAASSAVPLVFAPVTLNNNGGNCGYQIPKSIAAVLDSSKTQAQRNAIRSRWENTYEQYADSKARPYIHLLDGGLTDNLGMRVLLDFADLSSDTMMQRMHQAGIRRLVIISVNAQNELTKEIDKSANVPGVASVVSAIVDIPIDRYSQNTLQNFRMFAEQWNSEQGKLPADKQVNLSFVSLNLRDLTDPAMRQKMLNVPTSFYLPAEDVDNLRQSATFLMQNSSEYQKLLKDLGAKPNLKAAETTENDDNDDNGADYVPIAQRYPAAASAVNAAQ